MKNNLLPKQSIFNIVRLTVVIACGVLAGNYMLASPAQAVTISQPILEINAAPGETIYQLEQLYDDAKKGITVYPWVYNFTENPDREGSAIVLTDPADLQPDREWIKYDASRVDLPADGSLVDFPYRIEVPANGEPGTHLISLVFRSRPPTQEDLDGTTVYIGSTVATNIFLKVSGRIVDLINVE
ncbi:hypothetical protein IID19_00990, partial [Patescibacteria group bacterium]|nr:hypothetical protein [Patescibacteria group bacterium]